MRATEQRTIREARRSSVRPVNNVMCLDESRTAAWESAAAISHLECAAECGWDRARSAPNVEDGAVAVSRDVYHACVAREPSSGFWRETRAILEVGASRFNITPERIGFHVQDDLVTFGTATADEAARLFRGSVCGSPGLGARHDIATLRGNGVALANLGG